MTPALVNAEWIKLSTTRSALWSVIGAGLLSLGVAALQGVTAYDYSPLPPEKAVLGVAAFGVPVLMILSSLTVTGEYRTGLIRTTFLANPDRTIVLVTKAVVSGLFSALCVAVMAVAAIVVARLAAEPLAGSLLSLSVRSTWWLVGAIALYAMLAAVLGVAVGALLRFAAGAVAVLLLWPLVAEPILGNMPSFGPRVGPYLPFANAFRFIDVGWLYPVYDVAWGRFGSLLYFAAVVAVVFVAAVVLWNRRDA